MWALFTKIGTTVFTTWFSNWLAWPRLVSVLGKARTLIQRVKSKFSKD